MKLNVLTRDIARVRRSTIASRTITMTACRPFPISSVSRLMSLSCLTATIAMAAMVRLRAVVGGRGVFRVVSSWRPSQFAFHDEFHKTFQKMISKVSLSGGVAGGNDSDIIERVAETACYTCLAEPYMVEKYATSEEFWANYDIQPSWAYFGAHDGLYTAVPAIYQKACGELQSSLLSMVHGRVKRPQGYCISHRHRCIEEHVQVREDEHHKGRRGNHCQHTYRA
jgi:hypothetical protein